MSGSSWVGLVLDHFSFWSSHVQVGKFSGQFGSSNEFES